MEKAEAASRDAATIREQTQSALAQLKGNEGVFAQKLASAERELSTLKQASKNAERELSARQQEAEGKLAAAQAQLKVLERAAEQGSKASEQLTKVRVCFGIAWAVAWAGSGLVGP